VDNTVHQIDNYAADSAVCFVTSYPLDSNLSGGYDCLGLKQLMPACHHAYTELFTCTSESSRQLESKPISYFVFVMK